MINGWSKSDTVTGNTILSCPFYLIHYQSLKMSFNGNLLSILSVTICKLQLKLDRRKPRYHEEIT